MSTTQQQQFSRLHGPSLAAGLLLMLAATLYPPMFQRADGSADHMLAALLFAAMSTGLVRGVGYVPVRFVLRWLFSGWSCLLCLLLAAMLKI
ncbi:cyd operon YbgE family protein [Duganella qianjiadongensis]|uniref:Cyd operon protein YbgE n=1 Tax=Duganella qianjiadongensis TaxID=2692176 RepID=A0ABW9VK13_9BURK|nr:cyd operon YbgE family protein [Duganella qianjiadongensis]MYM39406.1 hypothetical protein [Duganella qianjiadongensis]